MQFYRVPVSATYPQPQKHMYVALVRYVQKKCLKGKEFLMYYCEYLHVCSIEEEVHKDVHTHPRTGQPAMHEGKLCYR